MVTEKWTTLTRDCNKFARIVEENVRLSGENDSTWLARCYKTRVGTAEDIEESNELFRGDTIPRPPGKPRPTKSQNPTRPDPRDHLRREEMLSRKCTEEMRPEDAANIEKLKDDIRAKYFGTQSRDEPERWFNICRIFLLFRIVVSSLHSSASQVGCSNKCVAQNSIGIRYGKYCGVGWSGCPGEKPCDDLDACCQIHDNCVEKKGMTDVKCHEKFKRCIKKVHKSGKPGFSSDCPYDTAVPTMQQGMDMAILFSQFGNSKLEL
ncbi:probable phospholipase A2 homolog 1 [Tanacetum coccineum]